MDGLVWERQLRLNPPLSPEQAYPIGTDYLPQRVIVLENGRVLFPSRIVKKHEGVIIEVGQHFERARHTGTPINENNVKDALIEGGHCINVGLEDTIRALLERVADAPPARAPVHGSTRVGDALSKAVDRQFLLHPRAPFLCGHHTAQGRTRG